MTKHDSSRCVSCGADIDWHSELLELRRKIDDLGSENESIRVENGKLRAKLARLSPHALTPPEEMLAQANDVIGKLLIFCRGDDPTDETCLRCDKHISRHYGGEEYRCYPKGKTGP